MKEHFEPRQVDVGSLKYRHRELEVELASVTRQIEKILQTESVRAGISLPAIANIDDEITETEVMAALRRRLVDLESLANREDQIEGMRRRLSRWRQAVQHFQKEVSNARREWCELLRKLGLSETIKISEAFQSWEKIAESR
jgi:predicted nuclease with TOPRIM domain